MLGRTSVTSADCDLSDQEGEKAQADDQLVGSERGGAGTTVAQADIVETHTARGKQRDRHVAVNRGIEPGDSPDLRLHGLADAVRRDRQRERQEPADAQNEQSRDGKSEALDAGGRRHVSCFPVLAAEPLNYSDGGRRRNIARVCVAFVAGFGMNPGLFNGFRLRFISIGENKSRQA